jgi:hypothetical protein
MMKPDCDDAKECNSSIIIASDYFDIVPKEERILFFFGDADYDKIVFSNADFFEGTGMELLLGHYFFIKYEDDLLKLFAILHEPEEYSDMICSSSTVATCSVQCALDARAAEANVIYMKKAEDSACLLQTFETFGIKIIDGFDKEQLIESLNSPSNERKVPNLIIEISKKIANRINL